MAFSKIKASLVMTVFTLTSPTLAETRLVAPPQEGYFVAHEQANEEISIKEEIPLGETLETWTSMITTQRFDDMPVTALDFARLMASNASQSCQNSAASTPGELEHQGFPAAYYSATCYDLDANGKPETFFMLIIQAPDALHIRQVAYKADVNEANMRAAATILRSAVICDEDCPAELQ